MVVPRAPFSACLLGMLVVAWSAGPLHGQPDSPEQLRAAVAKLEDEAIKSQAELYALTEEEKLISGARPRAGKTTAGQLSPGDPLMQAIRKQLETAHEARRVALRRLADDFQADRNRALDGLAKARETAQLAHEQLLRAEANPASKDPGGVFDIWLALIILVAFVVVAAAVGLRAQLERVRFREWRRARGLAILAAAFLGVAAALAAGDDTNDPKQRYDRLRRELPALTAEVSRKQAAVELHRKAVLARLQALLTAPGEGGGDLAADATRWEEEDYKLLHDALVSARVVELATKRGSELMKQAREDRNAAGELRSGGRSHNLWRHLARLGACIAFPVLGLVVIYRARSKYRRRVALQEDQCPRCLAEGSLDLKQSLQEDSRYPEPKYVYCTECAHEFRVAHRKLPRLCFPTVGVRASGKTHWLVMAYDLIKNNNVPVAASLQKAPSLADDEFDTLVQLVLESHQAAYGTTHGVLPSPLTFYLRDVDPWGRNAALLNLFDFSGEMMGERIQTDVLRRRALLMDGFVLFLDPTQVQSKEGGLGIDTQIKQLANFHEEMREMRGLDDNAHIDVPVAVCVSKLDLLVNHIGSHARVWLSKLRDTASRAVTLELLQERSRMLQDQLPTLFSGSNITRTLQDQFGKRFLFFPMTPVGMEEGELGVEDLARRTFAPFGVLEPILWLLHMRGYSVLPRESAPAAKKVRRRGLVP